MAQGLSVYESMNLEDFLKKNIQGLSDNHIKAILALTDGIKGRKFNKYVDVKGMLVYDTTPETDDNDADLTYAEVNMGEALEEILDVRGLA